MEYILVLKSKPAAHMEPETHAVLGLVVSYQYPCTEVMSRRINCAFPCSIVIIVINVRSIAFSLIFDFTVLYDVHMCKFQG